MKNFHEKCGLTGFKPASRKLLGLLLALLALKGCAGFGRRMEPPRISLVNIRVQRATLFETTLRIELRVYNTNDVALTLKGADCRLALQGKEVASGVSSERTVIPAFATAVVPLVVYSPVLNVVRGLLALPGEEQLEYALSGRVYLEGGMLTPASLPFRSEGKLALKEFNVK